MNGKLVITLDDGSKIRGKVRRLSIDMAAPPVIEPPVDRMLLGANMTQYWGDQTENGRLLPDGTLDPRFVSYMEPFSVHRPMETVITNQTLITDTDTPPHPGWTFAEVADHARVLGTRPWVCVPHMATDTFVQYLAYLFLGLHPIVEYSNEPHNTGFPQSVYAADRAVELGLCSPDLHPRQRMYHFTSQRTREIGDLWRAIDPDCEVVYSIGMTDPPWTQYLYLIDDSLADAVCTAAYLGIESAWPAYTHVRSMTVEQGISWLLEDSLPRLVQWVTARKGDAEGLPLYIYEGGQHVKGDICGWSIPAQGTDGMGLVYSALLEALDTIGVGLFCNYQGPKPWSGYHTFGIIETHDEWTPKYRALRDWAGV